MNEIAEVLGRADVVMCSKVNIERIELPALRSVMEQVVKSREGVYGYSKYTDHSKSSTGGCAMGCLGG